MEEDVGGFEISVQNILGVKCFKCVSKLLKDLDCFLLGESSFGLDMLCQGSTVTILINQVVVVGSPQHFYKLNDVDVVYLREDSDLVIGEFAEFGCVLKFLYVHDLHSVDLLVFPILSFVDVSVLALSDFLEENVILNNLVHFTCELIAKLISMHSPLRS